MSRPACWRWRNPNRELRHWKKFYSTVRSHPALGYLTPPLVGSGKFDAVRNSEVGLVKFEEAGINSRDGILLELLLVVDEEPRAVEQDRPVQTSAKLLQNVHRPEQSVRLVDCIIGARSGVAVVVEGAAVEIVGTRARDHIHEAGSSVAILGTIGRNGNLELLQLSAVMPQIGSGASCRAGLFSHHAVPILNKYVVNKEALPHPTHDAAWWEAETKGFDFSQEERIDSNKFNRIIWEGANSVTPLPCRIFLSLSTVASTE